MQAERKPYELLVRWDANGTVTAAHIQWADVITDDNSKVKVYPLPPEPCGISERAKGYPLTDILPQLHASALTSVEQAKQKNDDLTEQLQVVSADRDRLALETQALRSRIQRDAES